jgi:hypothetical protein
MNFKYILNNPNFYVSFFVSIVIISIVIFALDVFIKNNNIYNNIEGLDNLDTDIIMKGSDSFCETNIGSGGDLETSCNKLTQSNCNSTSCCVWTSDNKCKAGAANGPTFNTDGNGKTKKLGYYYFKNKCYGLNCPKDV